MKRRKLHKIRLDEISAVDRPAQEHARMTIMKRERDDELQMDNSDMAEFMGDSANCAVDANVMFEAAVTDLRQRGFSGTEALRKARQDLPEEYATFAKGKTRPKPDEDEDDDDFDSLVQTEIRKGCPAAVAGQRVLQKYGARPNANRIRKSASTIANFMKQVDDLMIQKRLSRTEAFREVRNRNPDLYAEFQEV